MRSVLRRTLTFVLPILALLPGTHAALGGSKAADYVPNEIVLKLASAADLEAVAGEYGLHPAPLESLGPQATYRMRILGPTAPPDLAGALLLDPRVIFAEPNAIGQAPEARSEVSWAIGGDAGTAAGQWATASIRLAQAHTVSTGRGVRVAVLDTGIDPAHPALVGRLDQGFDFVDGDTQPAEVGVPGIDPIFGHGTHVAGIIALTAPGARILPVRVLDRDGATTVWRVAAAMLYAIDPDGNPATADGAQVINLSLSTTRRSALLKDVIGAVTCADLVHRSPNDLPCLYPDGRGAVVVAAAGNSASTAPEFPAGDSLNGTIAVGASNASGGIAIFSNLGSWVDLLAPGDLITSTVPGGAYGTWSGTSMASPFTAGVAALVRARFPNSTASKAAQRVVSTAYEAGGPVKFRLDAAAAVGVP